MKTKKQNIILFIQNNKMILLGCLAGLIAGFCYWEQVGCYWGAYPYSSVWWVNALSGAILGGLTSCSIQNRLLPTAPPLTFKLNLTGITLFKLFSGTFIFRYLYQTNER